MGGVWGLGVEGLEDWHINYVDSENGKGKNFYRGEQSISAKAKIA